MQRECRISRKPYSKARKSNSQDSLKSINIRWTGKKYTVLDYELMTVRERNALDPKDLDEIEKDREQMQENADSEADAAN